MTYSYAIEKRDIARIDKLNTIMQSSDIFENVRKWAKNSASHAAGRWQILAEARYDELKEQEAKK